MIALKLFFASLIVIGTFLPSDGVLASGKRYYQRISDDREAVEGSGALIHQTRSVDPFQRVESSLAVDLKIEVGKAQSITITFDDNLIDFIRTNSDGRTLIIDSDESYSTRNNLKIVITVPQLDLVNLEGSGTIAIINLDSRRFRAIISGSGELTANGKVDLLEIEINGSGDARADEVVAREVTVSINGSGSAEVNAVEVLDGEINGSGDILYVGEPGSVQSSVNGSGTIRKKK